ncbi:hypothetical protein A2856_00200 [Candidatus Uhrbacteria bacterium RIFCSPHIGHO2_01_FULL_63_20]|uniref:Chloroplast import component protein (Tic20) n=1 Tax=Candidatus Uhrbacteria bacterium RIFCSPHIGHO2_01_FULL_63_20 TaxID=1802385 RepID=A0A1F7TMY8_9BACT|nr:MAG: hypothetical protein A2856_00200 [Candidatus Uhrbacteria bacterium RIFCSPHIGHO2_01_FULL_63_20]
MTEDVKKPMTDEQENRLIAAVGYLGILCLVPLLLKKESAFAQHHGKQGLVLLIAWLVLWAGNIVPILGQIVWMLGSVVVIILAIMGIVNALNGKTWEMPVLGQFAKNIKL